MKIIRRILRPKHTAVAVVGSIVQGLEDGSVTLYAGKERNAMQKEPSCKPQGQSAR